MVLEDRPLELLKRSTWFDSELVDKGCTSHSIGGQCVGLAATAVESKHVQRTRSLAEWVLGSKRLELAHELGVTSAREISLDTPLECHETELVESSGRLPQESFVSDVCEGCTAPERKRLS
jgi:hypothetical protein